MKIGNTDFNTEAVKAMKLEDFKKVYEPILRGATLEEAYLACGGKIEKPKKVADEIREA